MHSKQIAKNMLLGRRCAGCDFYHNSYQNNYLGAVICNHPTRVLGKGVPIERVCEHWKENEN